MNIQLLILCQRNMLVQLIHHHQRGTFPPTTTIYSLGNSVNPNFLKTYPKFDLVAMTDINDEKQKVL